MHSVSRSCKRNKEFQDTLHLRFPKVTVTASLFLSVHLICTHTYVSVCVDPHIGVYMHIPLWSELLQYTSAIYHYPLNKTAAIFLRSVVAPWASVRIGPVDCWYSPREGGSEKITEIPSKAALGPPMLKHTHWFSRGYLGNIKFLTCHLDLEGSEWSRFLVPFPQERNFSNNYSEIHCIH